MKGGGDADRRRGSTEPAEEAMQGLLGLWTSRLEAWGSCERYSGVRIAGCTPAARNLQGRRRSPGAGPVENPERPRSNGTRRAAGDDPGSTKGSCGGRWRLGGRSGAGPRRSRGATGQSGVEAAALGFVGRRLRMGEQGGAARATYRAAAALACVHAVGKPARTAARISAARRGRRGAGVWGHGVSGSGRLRALRS